MQEEFVIIQIVQTLMWVVVHILVLTRLDPLNRYLDILFPCANQIIATTIRASAIQIILVLSVQQLPVTEIPEPEEHAAIPAVLM